MFSCLLVTELENVFSLGSRMGSTHWRRPHHSVNWDWLSWWKSWHLDEWTPQSSVWVNCLEMEAARIARQLLRFVIAPNISGKGSVNIFASGNWVTVFHESPYLALCWWPGNVVTVIKCWALTGILQCPHGLRGPETFGSWVRTQLGQWYNLCLLSFLSLYSYVHRPIPDPGSRI